MARRPGTAFAPDATRVRGAVASAATFAIRITTRRTPTYRWCFPRDAGHLGAYAPTRTAQVQ